MASYIFSVKLRPGCYRHIKISPDSTLELLSSAILNAFDFDNDHLHAFFLSGRFWDRDSAIYSSECNEGESTSDYALKEVITYIGQKIAYVFDFGDEWRFSLSLLKYTDEDTPYPSVIKSVGKAPSQYPDWDEDE